MNTNSVEVEISGIKCDTEGCSWRDDSVSLNDYKKWVDAECPQCKGNLLTKADYRTVKLMIGLAKVFNVIFPKSKGKRISQRVEMDGSGIPKFKEVE